MKLPRLSSNSTFAGLVNKAIDAIDDAIDETSGATQRNNAAPSGAYSPPPQSAEPAPPAQSYADLLASIPADHLYHLLPQADAERIIGSDASIVDDEVDSMTYTSLVFNRTPSDDAVGELTRRGGGEELDGIGDVAFYLADGYAAGDGGVDFAVGGVIYEVAVLASADGGIAASSGVREAAIEAARTVVRNLGA